MKHLRKYNESKKEFDVEFFQDVFQEFIDNGAEYESVDGSFFDISIKVPNLRSYLSTHGMKKLEGYIEKTNKIAEIMNELEVAINRIKSEYKDVLLMKVSETGNLQESFWTINIIIEPEETFPF